MTSPLTRGAWDHAAAVTRATTFQRLRPHALTLVAGVVGVVLMLVWAVHDGGYDKDTWYWGALVMVALVAVLAIARGPRPLPRAVGLALTAFALYTAWSYLSISWAQSPGDALDGSNRTLLFLLIFTSMVLPPWTARGTLAALLVFATGIGVTAVVLLFRLASAEHVSGLFIEGRLAAPTGYFNSTAALFTMGALTAVALAARRELPAPARGLLLAFACAELQLALVGQSRGWLFTLPLVALVAIVIVRDRLRVVLCAVLPAAGTLVALHRLLDVYKAGSGSPLEHAAAHAGRPGLLACAAVFFVATLVAWADHLLPVPRISPARRRALGTLVAVVVAVAAVTGAQAATHGHPVRFIERQWNGFSHPQGTSGSHFAAVGTVRYDFWRVALDAFVAHPVEGLGQDNFLNYYTPRRRSAQEPSYVHSLELRLLTHTGVVGFVLFGVFLVAALAAALPARRRGGLEAAVAGAALLALVVWVIHGSVDWFWEMPALSGPALGFLGMAGGLSASPDGVIGVEPVRPGARTWGALTATLGILALLGATVVLAFPYLAVREVSIATNLRGVDPGRALARLQTAADLNPLSADPGRLAGTIALESGRYAVAAERFGQVTARDPGGWFGWLGTGLAASALGDRSSARSDLERAASIERDNTAISAALARVDTSHPLAPLTALQLLVVAG
ncbi:MAG: O-antigen ligase family protein [Solirubrobacterales bacterium]|nr:O-antigen ligase family protein [Solirubrobacterales bacterium]